MSLFQRPNVIGETDVKLYGVLFGVATALAVVATCTPLHAVQTQEAMDLPTGPLAFGAFVCEFKADGTFEMKGQGWPPFVGTWKVSASELTLVMADDESDCPGPGRYSFEVEDGHLHLQLIADDCVPRRMVLDGSTWRPEGEVEPGVERRIVLTSAETRGPLPDPASAAGSWPSFRGPSASGVAEGQNLPDEWNGETGKNILWKTADSRPRPLEPHCLGRSPVRDERRQ